jgi:hypothetical protein
MWWRYLVGAAGALLLAGGGLLWWKTTAVAERTAIHGSQSSGTADTATGAGDADLPEPPAATEKSKEQRRFARYDKDKDGAVTRQEYLANRRKNFDKLDKNGDGVLSFDEYATKAVDKFAEADADHNGKLSPTEFATTRVQRKSKPRGCPPAAAAQDEHKGDDEN